MTPKISIIVPVWNCVEWLERALDSIPLTKDVQLILIDDGSTDGSWELAVKWWKDHVKDKWSIIHHWDKNKGVAAAMNLGFELADGEYIGSLSADDYYLQDFTKILPLLNGTNDLVYYDLEVNDGSIWHVDEKGSRVFVGGTKFMRREFLGDTRVPNKEFHEDAPFYGELLKKNPVEAFSNVVLKHYTWPREGSLIWRASHQGESNAQTN